MAELHIGILTPHRNPVGGVETVNTLLMRALCAHHVSLVATEDVQPRTRLQLIGSTIGGEAFLAKPALRARATAFDVLICNGEFGYRISHPCSINLFHGSAHGYRTAVLPYSSWKTRLHLARDAFVQKQSARNKFVVCVSQGLRTELELHGIRVDDVIDVGIDLEQFCPDVSEPRRDRALFVGRFDYFGKGFDTLEALVRSGVPVDCVTPSRPPAPLGWINFTVHSHMPSVYRRYRIVLVPSRFEGMSLSALEAMACGTPVLMSDVGLAEHLRRHIPEFVIEGRRARNWVAAIEMITRRFDHFSEAALAYVRQYHSFDTFSQKWNAVVDMVHATRRAS